MVKQGSALVLVGVVMLSACGLSGPPDDEATSRPLLTTEAREPGDSAGASNRVPEEPWWQREPDRATEPSADAPVPIDPPDVAFELSSDLLFDVGSAELSPAAASQLNHLVGLAEQNPDAPMVIVGHTDDTPGPTPGYNDELSLWRAEAVQIWLVGAGVSSDRITVEGRGDPMPIASNDTETGRSANRRVTITFGAIDG